MKTLCSCGCGLEPKHILGEGLCFRELVLKDEEPKKFGVDKILWKFPKQNPISDFTLTQQRGYSFHDETERWSKPKVRGDEWFESKGWN